MPNGLEIIHVLKILLSEFPVLPFSDMREEVSAVNLNHHFGSDDLEPVRLSQKMGDVQTGKSRLVTILTKALDQFPSWKRNTEMLSSMLWKEHEVKGAHKRQAFELEHLFDMITYLDHLKGFIDSSTFVDGYLKSTGDMLSRQLTCLTTQKQVGLMDADIPTPSYSDVNLDKYDALEPGLVIPEAETEALIDVDFGVASSQSEEEFLTDIG